MRRALVFGGDLNRSSIFGDVIYENEYRKEGGTWKIAKLHAWFIMYTMLDRGGWAKHNIPNTRPEKALPPDRRPTLARAPVGDRRVVPGGITTGWALVRDLSTGAPRPGARVEVRLLEGTIERHRAEATTDAGGTAAFRVPIPASRGSFAARS